MKKKSFFNSLFLIPLFSLFLLISCSHQDSNSKSMKGILSAAIVVDGPIDDGSFNKSTWEGLLKAHSDLGFKVAYKQTTQPIEASSAFNAFEEEEYSLITGVGYKMADITLEKAQTNLNQKYAIIDSTDFESIPSNFLPVGFHTEESAFLVGFLAGKVSKTKKIGFIGGISGDIIDTFDYGYRAGAYLADPEVEVIVQYADSFADVSKGKALANIMYQNGIDIIYQAAGATGIGVIEAAKESRAEGLPIWVIGADVDQSYLAPEAVLVSSLKNTGLALYNILKDLKEGIWEGGKVIEYGLEQGAVGISEINRNIDPYIVKEVLNLKEKLIDKEITAPYSFNTWQSFKKSN